MEYQDIELLRFTTAGSVDDGKSTLIGRLLYDSKSIFQDQLDAVEESSKNKGYDYVVNKFGDTTYCLRLTLAEEVYEWLEMWKGSPPHNKNMLHDLHEYAGYGHYKGIGVQMFSVSEEITGTLRFKVDTTLEKILIASIKPLSFLFFRSILFNSMILFAFILFKVILF